MSTGELLTINEVAAEMRCSKRLVSDLAREHGVGSNLKGRAGWRFSRTDLDVLLEAMRPKPTPVIAHRRRNRRQAHLNAKANAS